MFHRKTSMGWYHVVQCQDRTSHTRLSVNKQRVSLIQIVFLLLVMVQSVHSNCRCVLLPSAFSSSISQQSRERQLFCYIPFLDRHLQLMDTVGEPSVHSKIKPSLLTEMRTVVPECLRMKHLHHSLTLYSQTHAMHCDIQIQFCRLSSSNGRISVETE
jgi:hypothetical protein